MISAHIHSDSVIVADPLAHIEVGQYDGNLPYVSINSHDIAMGTEQVEILARCLNLFLENKSKINL